MKTLLGLAALTLPHCNGGRAVERGTRRAGSEACGADRGSEGQSLYVGAGIPEGNTPIFAAQNGAVPSGVEPLPHDIKRPPDTPPTRLASR